ncbi:RnfH family protein [Halorhodospira abdelmalekii]|uniref:RnfH family protein n=1 Tax=Halorhodospira abdelmalekii TaxID=421629 RepID=UPI0019037BAE|nr:RnfH family protein [Halorhodospira abdelmalekii]MBK1735110.1 RnfH family protein [Halorhodospira abdelmalekii]
MFSDSAVETVICVEVAYALPAQQSVIAVELPAGATVADAIAASGILERHSEIDLTQQAVGVFGQIERPETPLHNGDRVEIYRPLQVDPKAARRRRAADAKG